MLKERFIHMKVFDAVVFNDVVLFRKFWLAFIISVLSLKCRSSDFIFFNFLIYV